MGPGARNILILLVFLPVFGSQADIFDFSAIAYYSFHDTDQLDKSWPKRLDFESLKMDDKEYFKFRQGTWKLRSHCNGELSPDSIYTREDLTVVNLDDQSLVYNSVLGSKPNLVLGGDRQVSIAQNKDGSFAVTYTNRFGSSILIERPVRIINTNETAYIIYGATNVLACPSGLNVDVITIKVLRGTS